MRVHGEEEDIVPVTFLQYKHTLNATGGTPYYTYILATLDSLHSCLCPMHPYASAPSTDAVEDLACRCH